ncbi:MAG: HEAT repeat domain-containing protein [Anaerolineaceae bacterium]|nr:HEAT repeat domain-containing protein [Anaerolineaceae bacterium]
MFQHILKLTPEDLQRMVENNNARGLLRAFRHNDPAIFTAAEQGLMQIQPPPIPEICRTLNDQRTNTALKQRAARLLGKMGDASAISCLLDELQNIKDRDIAEHRTLAAVIAQALTTLEWAPTLDEIGARYWCAREKYFYCINCQSSALPPLLEELVLLFQIEKNLWSRRQTTAYTEIASVLEHLKTESTPAILALITAPPTDIPSNLVSQVQSRAAQLLLSFGRDIIAPINDALLTSTDSAIIKILISLTGQLGEESSIAPLLQTLRYSSKPLKSDIAEALNQIGGQACFSQCITSYQQWIEETIWEPDQPGYDRDQLSETEINLNYLERVLRNTNGDAITTLIDVFKDAPGDSPIFQRFQKTIVTINVAAIPALVELLKSPDERHQRRAVNLLERLADWHPTSNSPEDQAYFAIAKRIRDTFKADGIVRADSGICISLGEKAVAALTHTLKNYNYQVRFDAAQTLNSITSNSNEIESVINCNVALHNVEACVACGSKAVKPLIQNLKEAVTYEVYGFNEPMRKQALACVMQALVALGNAAKVDLIIRMEDPTDLIIRPYLTHVLMQVGSPAVNLLQNAGRSAENDDIRYEITRILYHISTSDSIPMRDYFYEKMKDTSPQVKNLAIQYTSKNPDSRSLRALRAIASDEDEQKSNRKTALQIIASQKNTKFLPDLLDFANDLDRDLQIIAVRGIEGLGPEADLPEATLLLIEFLTGKQGSLQRGAARALAAIGSPSIIDYLIDFLIQLDDSVRLETQSSKTQQEAKLAKGTRALVIETLSRIGEEVIVKMVSRKSLVNGELRGAFLETIKHMKKETAQRTLFNELCSSSLAVRNRAALFLQALHWEPTPHQTRCEDAARYAGALSKWKEMLSYGDCAIEPLKELLSSTDDLSRKIAVQFLDQLEWKPDSEDPIILCQYWIVRKEFQNCFVVGEKAVQPLVEELTRNQKKLEQAIKHGKGATSESLKRRQTKIKNALWGIGTDAIPALFTHFYSLQINDIVRAHIAHVLLYLGGQMVEEKMSESMINNDLLSVRLQSIWTLGEMGAQHTITPMLSILQTEESSEELQIEILQALRKILRKDLDHNLIENIRESCASLIEDHQEMSRSVTENAIQIIRICDRSY